MNSDIVLVLFLRYHKNVSSESTLQLIDHVVFMPQLEGKKAFSLLIYLMYQMYHHMGSIVSQIKVIRVGLLMIVFNTIS